VEDLLEIGVEFGLGFDQPLASTPFFRERSGGTSGRLLRSSWP
jgi:hypothetical protein